MIGGDGRGLGERVEGGGEEKREGGKVHSLPFCPSYSFLVGAPFFSILRDTRRSSSK